MNNPTYKHHFRFYGQKNGLRIDFGAISFLKVNDISKKKEIFDFEILHKKSTFCGASFKICVFS